MWIIFTSAEREILVNNKKKKTTLWLITSRMSVKLKSPGMPTSSVTHRLFSPPPPLPLHCQFQTNNSLHFSPLREQKSKALSHSTRQRLRRERVTHTHTHTHTTSFKHTDDVSRIWVKATVYFERFSLLRRQ